MRTLLRDLVYALRILAKRPGFTLAATLTLALGIAANTTMFTLVSAILLRPLPYPHSERLLSLWTSYPASNGQPDVFSPPNYLDLAARSKSFAAVGSYITFSFTLGNAGEPEYIPGIEMSASMSDVLGISPQLGRWFTAEEDETGQAVVLLSDSLWRSRYGADRDVLGRTLNLNGRTFTIIGVLPRRVGFPTVLTEIYAPISFTPDQRASRGSVFLNVVSRVREGTTAAAAVAELRTIGAQLAAEDAAINAGISMGAVPLQESMVGSVRSMLLVLWAAVMFMLAVGCANVANLLLTHAVARQREWALRRSLGASNWRLTRQLLTESVVLSFLGSAVGLVIAIWAVPLAAGHLPKNFPSIRDVALDSQVLWFTLGVSVLTGLLFGLAPVATFTRGDLAQAMREDSRSSRTRGSGSVGKLLVVGEVAVVLVLLVGAGLVLRSLGRLSNVNPGFRTNNLIAWQVFLPPSRYPNADAQRTVYRRLLEQAQSLPGVQSVGFGQPLPFGPIDMVADSGFEIAGRPPVSADTRPQALITRASAGYFSTMGIPIRSGRVFTELDGESSTAAVVSEGLARRYFGDKNPVGQRLLLGRGKLQAEIVGVVGDVKHLALDSDVRPELYLPLAAFVRPTAGLVVRTNGSAAAMIPSLQQGVWSVDSGFAANLAAPVEQFVYASLAPARLTTLLLSFFALATLVLGLVGIYGVLSYTVRQGTREIGIRIALGATTRQVLRMVLSEALRLAGAGVAIGVVAALLLSRYVKALLYDVGGSDIPTYLLIGICVMGAAVLAAYAPARRATRVDPALSLRAE